MEYTGPRDANIAGLYEVFKGSLARQAALAESHGSDWPIRNQRIFEQHSAYLNLIQAQRFYRYTYDQLSGVPNNSADVVYHSTNRGGLNVVFELTRAEFPEYFRLKDAEERALQEVK